LGMEESPSDPIPRLCERWEQKGKDLGKKNPSQFHVPPQKKQLSSLSATKKRGKKIKTTEVVGKGERKDTRERRKGGGNSLPVSKKKKKKKTQLSKPGPQRPLLSIRGGGKRRGIKKVDEKKEFQRRVFTASQPPKSRTSEGKLGAKQGKYFREP